MKKYCRDNQLTRIGSASTFGDLSIILLEILAGMPQPVVMVFGPMKTGGAGNFDANMERFGKAVNILETKGYTVFDQAFPELQEALERILQQLNLPGYPVELMVDELHRKLFESGFISKAFFLPGWEGSKGTAYERKILMTIEEVKICDFSLEWF